MRVRDVMSAPAVTVPPHALLADVIRRMADHAVGSVVVVEDDVPCGIVTDRDLAMRVLGVGLSLEARVSEVMSPRPVTVAAADELHVAYRAMRLAGVRRLPVLDGRRVVGMVTADDLLLDVFQRLADLLGPVARSILEETPGPPGQRR
ncbi:cyclic nucleotide-binding/CBS domain-containing protein [Streptomyces sp. NPDC006012]|uniref:CBS domain-containing protein n=1 Tax=Streptomyces sp. NPDC006012 TaxID=3364739 RepID=UPI00368982EE